MSFEYCEPGGVGVHEQSGWDGTRALFTSRVGGVSSGPYSSMNLGSGGGDSPENVAENRRILLGALGIADGSLLCVRQAHSSRVYVHTGPHDAPPEEGSDAIVTGLPGLAIGVLVADCVPILLYDPINRAVGAVHAGWSGTAGLIAKNAVDAMVATFGSRPKDILAAIGPSIGPCCYEVDDRVVRPMAAAFGEGAGIVSETRPGHFKIDLWTLNRAALMQAGLASSDISTLGQCTACNPDMYYSYRRDGQGTGRMMGLIMLGGEAGRDEG